MVIAVLALTGAGVAVAAPIVGRLVTAAPASGPAAAPSAPLLATDTPIADRVATIGILNKRNGLSRDLHMRPGEAVRIGNAVIRLKSCETTADWEADKLTGAFVQLIVRGADEKWRKVFSGWLFKETPSLNVVEHPIYDVWAKDCTMRHADVGPGTVTLSGRAEPAVGGAKRSRAKKSPDATVPTEPDAAPAEATTADASNPA